MTGRAGRRDDPPRGNRLITIPISHFCEKARWALDRARIPYTEEPHVQWIHIAYARRAGGGRTVPVLLADDGAVLPESAAILRWADGRLDPDDRLYPAGAPGSEVSRIEAWLDTGLGPDGRLWMYESTLPSIRGLMSWIVAGTPRWERVVRSGGWAMDPFIRRYLGVSAAKAAVARTRVDAVFDAVAAMLADGRPFLCGERFTAADLTFASLSAAVLIPAGYGSPLPPLRSLPAEMADAVRRWRGHEAGLFANRLYAQHRHRVVPGVSS